MATVGDTPAFSFFLMKNFGSNLSNIAIKFTENDEEEGFILPESADIFNKSIQDSVISVNVCLDILY